MSKGRHIVIVGAPDDRGVAIVGGRVGASGGPAAIRRTLLEQGGGSFTDEGNIPVLETQGKTYQALHQKVRGLHGEGKFPVLLGGGHDLSFGSLSGFLDVYPGGGIVNIDPHLDARPVLEEGKYSSGSAYRLLLERGLLEGRQLMEFGFQMQSNQPANFEYLKSKGVQLVPWPADIEALKLFAQSVPALAVSFDMDSIREDFAPGVSAPAKTGYTAEEALALIHAVKQFTNLKQFEIMETNPRFDPDGRTVKLAATLLAELMAGDFFP